MYRVPLDYRYHVQPKLQIHYSSIPYKTITPPKITYLGIQKCGLAFQYNIAGNIQNSSRIQS